MRHHAKGIELQEAYPPEFRREAVELYRRSGRSLSEIASNLGVSSESRRLECEVMDGKVGGIAVHPEVARRRCQERISSRARSRTS